MVGKRKLRDLLDSPDRGVGRASGIPAVLSNLFRNMLGENGITPMKWRSLMDDYVQKEAKHYDNRRDRTSIRGNLNKEFGRSRMTWKVFCKAMMFLQVRRFKIYIVAEYDGGVVRQHEYLVSFDTATETPPADGVLELHADAETTHAD